MSELRRRRAPSKGFRTLTTPETRRDGRRYCIGGCDPRDVLARNVSHVQVGNSAIPRIGRTRRQIEPRGAERGSEIEGKRRGELDQLGMERHGAIRLGTPDELSTIRRLFMVMGMVPVGYYDLSVAGIPVHSTAFRPTSEEALRRNPFRVFTSLLRLDLIEDEEARRAAARRWPGEIFSRRAVWS